MKREIFNSNRYFTTFDILVSHGQLLLRSQKNNRHKSNIDIIFFDTAYIQLFSKLDGIEIKMLSDKSIIEYKSVANYLSYDNNLFEILSGNEKYYIAASFVNVFENELEFNETSLNFENKGREKEIATSITR